MKSPILNLSRMLCALGVFATVGVIFALCLRSTHAGQPDIRTGYNIFYVVFARDEVCGLALTAIFSFSAAAYFFLFAKDKPPQSENAIPLDAGETMMPRHRMITFILIAATFAIAALGTNLVCHDYALSADEFMADFQAQIFLRGHLTAPIPPDWQDAVRVICPTYAQYLPQTHSWMAAYLPIYAAMRAAFQLVYLQSFLNPFLAAVTLIALYGVIAEIWPDNKEQRLIGMLLLAVSPQFLVMSMTQYAMTAHLAFNTAWLWLYLQPKKRYFYLAPVIGVLAIGLHQPIVHALFVAPFLFRLARNREWRKSLIFGIIYAIGCAGWYLWRRHFAGVAGPPLSFYFHLWNPKMLFIQPMDFWLILGWSALVTPLLVLLSIGRLTRAPAVIRDAGLSCLLTFGFYYFFALDQGNGWGYRYFYGALACFILVGVAGWDVLVAQVGRPLALNFLLVGASASILLQVPLRCHQAETFIRPFALASNSIHAMTAGVVGIEPDQAWYSADLIRNDPFLENRPVIFALIHLSPGEVDTLSRHGPARFLKKPELAEFGLTTTISSASHRAPFHLGAEN